MAGNKDKLVSRNPQNGNGGTPSVLPCPDFRFPGEIGRTYLDSDPAQFPQPVQAPSPTMDKLASEGLRYNHFHTK